MGFKDNEISEQHTSDDVGNMLGELMKPDCG